MLFILCSVFLSFSKQILFFFNLKRKIFTLILIWKKFKKSFNKNSNDWLNDSVLKNNFDWLKNHAKFPLT